MMFRKVIVVPGCGFSNYCTEFLDIVQNFSSFRTILQNRDLTFLTNSSVFMQSEFWFLENIVPRKKPYPIL